MKKHPLRVWTMALLIVGLGLSTRTAQAQEKAYSEIVGDYDLDLGGQTLPFKILLIEAKLFFDAQVPGQNPQLMTPVDGKVLTFKSIDPNGDDCFFAFMKSDKGKITGCTVTLPSRNAEAKATKVEKK